MAMRRNPEKLVLALLMGAGGLLLASQDLRAQEERKKPAPTDRDAPTEAPDDPLPTMFPHFESDRIWLRGQYRSGYCAQPLAQQGPLSCQGNRPQSVRLEHGQGPKRPQCVIPIQGASPSAPGNPLWKIQHGGFLRPEFRGFRYPFSVYELDRRDRKSTRLNSSHQTFPTRRSSDLKAPYLARGIVHKVFALSTDKVLNDRNALSLFKELPRRRLEIRFGKFSMVDFFDQNSVGSDTHFQFTNWTVDNKGAYDYAADTRGYTVGVTADYEDRNWGLRFAEALMPKVANGIDLVWKPWQAHAESFEYELRHGLIPNK